MNGIKDFVNGNYIKGIGSIIGGAYDGGKAAIAAGKGKPTTSSRAKASAGNKAVPKPKAKPKCSFLEGVGQWFQDRGRDVNNFAGDVWNGISTHAGNFWNGLKSGANKLVNDTGAFFGDMWNSVVATVTSPKFWIQAGVTTALAVATGGSSLWVQALVMGTGYTLTGEGYDFASTGLDIDKFFAMKGAKNPGEYLGGVIFDAALDSGVMYGGLKLKDYIKRARVAKHFLNNDTKALNNMTKGQLKENMPKNWSYFENNGRIHIKDTNGNFRIRIDPADKVTNYQHMHIFDASGNSLDINGNIVGKKSPDGHIPWNK